MNYFARILEISTFGFLVYLFLEIYQGRYHSQYRRCLHYVFVCTGITCSSLFLPQPLFYIIWGMIFTVFLILEYHKELYAVLYNMAICLGVTLLYAWSTGDTFTNVVFYRDAFLLTVMTIVVLFITKRRDTKEHHPYAYLFMIICLLQALMLLVLMWYIPPDNTLFINVLPFLLLLSTLVLYRIMYRNGCVNAQVIRLLEQQYLAKGNEERYDQLMKEQEYLARQLHDLKKHLRLLNTLPQCDDTLIQYRKAIHAQVQQLVYHSMCDNPYVERILQSYMGRFHEASISVNLELEDVGFSSIDTFDFYGMMLNLFDNALESCLKCDERFILLRIRKLKDHYLMIRMKNSCRDVLQERGQMLSMKANATRHGFGLRNINMIALRYHGALTYEFDEEHHIFVTTIHLRTTDEGNGTTSA